MDTEGSRRKLQHAYRELAHRYAPYLTTAATLTLKQYARIRVPRFENDRSERFEFTQSLGDNEIRSTAKRFQARLTHYLYGNLAKHENKQAWAKPLILVAIEGRKTHKLPHFHIAVGNIPEQKLPDIGRHIANAWHDCDFGNEQVCVKPLKNYRGWLDYMTKEVGYTDDDALEIEHMCVPTIIQNSICTESRLLKD